MWGEFLENKEKIPEGIQHLREEENLYIYGNGMYAEGVYQILKEWNICVKGVLVSDEYFTSSVFHELEVFTISDKRNERINVIAGYDIFKYENLNKKLLDLDNVGKIYSFEGMRSFLLQGDIRKDIIVIDNYYKRLFKRELGYEYFQEHYEQFTQTYDWLDDELSKKTMECYLRGHIELKSWPMLPVWDKTRIKKQYFAEDIIKLSQHEVFVDCGAFTGDTLEIFAELVESFDRYYLCEPNDNNVTAINSVILKVRNKGEAVHIPVGVSDKKGKAYFCDLLGSGSMIEEVNSEENAGSYIELDSIDNIVADKDTVTFIKMDIEGAEMSALCGAKDIIKRDKPKLAICVYHKREDLITIPQYIKELVPEYKLYLRAHFPTASELVLYAVCDEE